MAAAGGAARSTSSAGGARGAKGAAGAAGGAAEGAVRAPPEVVEDRKRKIREAFDIFDTEQNGTVIQEYDHEDERELRGRLFGAGARRRMPARASASGRRQRAVRRLRPSSRRRREVPTIMRYLGVYPDDEDIVDNILPMVRAFVEEDGVDPEVAALRNGPRDGRSPRRPLPFLASTTEVNKLVDPLPPLASETADARG